LVGIFFSTALFMAVYESLKEIFFKGALTPWESHTITVIVTASFATVASFFMRKWLLELMNSFVLPPPPSRLRKACWSPMP